MLEKGPYEDAVACTDSMRTQNTADLVFRNPVLISDDEIDNAQPRVQQTYFSTVNVNLAENMAAFGELYGGEPSSEPEVIHLEPRVQMPISTRLIAAACRKLLRASKVEP